MKEKLKEKYFPKYCRNRFLDQLHNLCRGDMSVQDHMAKFKNLTLCCDVREHCSHTVT